ncbi:MAG: glutamate racemase [Oscillospiraceae bacterium]
MNTKPIGVFDSGVGGLTAVRMLRNILPGEDIVYFGDTGRVPYGSHSKKIITSYAKQDIAFLLSKKVKAVLAACGTVSSTLLPEQTATLPVPYTGVVGPTAKAAALATRTKKIGIIGTNATIASGSYQKALEQIMPEAKLYATACPLFVPLVEEGYFLHGDALATLAVQQYLAPLKKAEVDTLILGCTHYPLLQSIIQEEMGSGVTLVDSGKETALFIKGMLNEQGLLNGRETGGTLRCYVSDDPLHFGKIAEMYLGNTRVDEIGYVDIERYQL